MQTVETIKKELSIKGAEGLPLSFDVNYKPSKNKLPVVLLVHGFKGFKDWGAYNLVAEYLATLGVFFIKMNFSHNGVNPTQLHDITDLETFSQNTISKELKDLDCMLQWINDDKNEFTQQIDKNQTWLIGHSRGGATALLKTISDSRIAKLALWAPVADLSAYATDPDGTWKEKGVKYIPNARTGAQMPLKYDMVIDYKANEDQYDTKRNIAKLDKPLFLIHGTSDETLPIAHTRIMYEFVGHSIMLELEGANHTFGAFHPYTETELPEDLALAAEETIEFFMM